MDSIHIEEIRFTDCVRAIEKEIEGIPGIPHNKALQLTANPLRGLSMAELGR